MTRSNPTSWGLKIPGRPPTPSEGYAQQYDRIGPAETQKLWTFDNGTCLTYGPDDLVDEFDPVLHPFCNQVALIDTLIRDNIAVRARYELSKGNETADEVDPFDNFRQRNLDPSTLSTVKLASGIYLQVPSRFATVGNLASVYATPNKSDTPGEAHRGLTNDTRFGMCGKPSYNPLSQMVNREDNIHRLTMQRQIQSGVSRARRGPRGRQLPQQLARIPTRFHYQYAEEQNNKQPSYQPNQENQSGQQQLNHQQRRTMRGQQKTRARGGGNIRGKRKDSIHRHERFRSQACTVADTPISNFSFPIINNTTKKFAFQDYEDEGPSAETPRGGYFRDSSYEDGYSTDYAEVGNLGGLSLDGLRIDHLSPLPMAKHHHGIPASGSISQGTYPQMIHVGGYQGIQVGGHFEGHSPPIASAYQPNHRSAIHHTMTLQEEPVGKGDIDMVWAEMEYSKWLDELNRAHARGVLEGDEMNAPASSGQLPTKSFDSMQDLDSARELASRGSPTNNNHRSMTVIVDSIRAKRFFRPNIGGSSTRPVSPTAHEAGRLSEPPRNRPSLASPLMFEHVHVEGAARSSKLHGEDPGNVSTDSSSFGGQARVNRRRFYK